MSLKIIPITLADIRRNLRIEKRPIPNTLAYKRTSGCIKNVKHHYSG